MPGNTKCCGIMGARQYKMLWDNEYLVMQNVGGDECLVIQNVRGDECLVIQNMGDNKCLEF